MIIRAKLLTCCRGWAKVNLKKEDFEFVSDYSKECSNTQIWKDLTGEYFILREVEILE